MGQRNYRRTGLSYLSGLVATLLACGGAGGVTTSVGPATSADALRADDVILVHATENEQRSIYAVTRGETVPTAWSGTPIVTPTAEPRPQPALATPPPPADETLQNWDTLWSADGRYAVHTVERQGSNRPPLGWDTIRPLYFFDGQTGQHDIIRQEGVLRPQRWSADGRYLFANIRTSFERWERATGEWTHLSYATRTYVGQTPDGQQWLWRDSQKFYLSDVNGEQFTPLAVPEGHNVSEHQRHLHWSPDGQMLAFQTFNFPRPYTYTIQIASLPSGEVRQLYTQSGTTLAGGYTMTWSPDSQYIAFLGNGRCVSTAQNIGERGIQTLCDAELFVIPVAGGEAQRVTNTSKSAVKIWRQDPIAWHIKE